MIDIVRNVEYRDLLEEKISKKLHEMQKRMPPGQTYNLHSEGACDMLAREIYDVIEEHRLNN